ncbi:MULTISPECIES: Hsp20/alpha crystallin family protein [Comamonas]|uniref:Hsp20/alpha crystallin family protein n=1 Tax=Comamonas TaxID=283 RepID=UPI0012C034E4|nr:MULTISPECIES: Hsp20/alpha crystallin family protein [Comamonas]MEB5967145.1 Hsp20/alpha crystallin family protein [Comamonas testosteroni]MPS92528.1 Hsp20/alpha crystallin family protein [Comamonas sp.]
MNSLITRGSLFDDLFKDVASGFFVRPLHGESLPAASDIKIDVQENDADFVVHAEMPGVSKDKISVSVEGSTVQIRAEVEQKDEQRDNGRLIRSERYYGAVSRGFTLPSEVDSAQAKAKYTDGVLRLTLPKKAQTTSQRLLIE